MRLGFVLGFLLGGTIASVLARSQQDHAGQPGTADGPARPANPVAGIINDARDAAKEAQLEKEAEMLRMYDEMVHRKEPPPAP